MHHYLTALKSKGVKTLRNESFKVIAQLHVNITHPKVVDLRPTGVIPLIHYFYIRNFLNEPTTSVFENMYIPPKIEYKI